jgi:hypothetical protein
MRSKQELLDDPRMQSAIEELKSLILANYPSTTFDVGWDEDPCGIYLDATVDVEDRTEVFDAFGDRLVDFQVFDELPIYVSLTRTPEKEAEVRRKLASGIREVTFSV